MLGSKDIKCEMTKRHCVTDLDKCEPILKPLRLVKDHTVAYSHNLRRLDWDVLKPPHTYTKPQQLALRPEDSRRPHKGGSKKAHSVKVLPSSVHHQEPYHADCPNVTLQARCRQNDGDPPFNVKYGTYLPRSNEFGTRRGYMAGDTGPAPWRHTSTAETIKPHTYVSDADFERYRHPPTMILRAQHEGDPPYERMIQREEYLKKNASRTELTPLDHTLKNNTQKFRTAKVSLSVGTASAPSLQRL